MLYLHMNKNFPDVHQGKIFNFMTKLFITDALFGLRGDFNEK